MTSLTENGVTNVRAGAASGWTAAALRCADLAPMWAAVPATTAVVNGVILEGARIPREINEQAMGALADALD